MINLDRSLSFQQCILNMKYSEMFYKLYVLVIYVVFSNLIIYLVIYLAVIVIING